MFFITSVIVLFLATGDRAQFGWISRLSVSSTHSWFGLIVMFGVVSGGHFNPAVTLAAAAIKRISRWTRRSPRIASSKAVLAPCLRGCWWTRDAPPMARWK
jgi:glycerol uptake facilitator-like aquaporin